MEQKAASLHRLLTQSTPVSFSTDGKWLIYGAGGRGRQARGILERHGASVQGFIDQRADELGEVEGLPVFRPGAVPVELWADSSVLIALFNPDSPHAPVYELLQFPTPRPTVNYFEFYEVFAAEVGDAFWLTQRQQYQQWSERIEQAYGLLADDDSRAVFEAALRLRLHGDWQPLENLKSENPYFPDGVPTPSRLRMVDGGACVGDALRTAVAVGKEIDAVYGFEPDAQNFSRLRSALAGKELPAASALLWPSGLWSGTTLLRFHSGLGTSSRLGDDGDTIVPVVALDEVLPVGSGVNFVKLDIEGAEADALKGMRRLLEEQRPHLAVCVYHRPEDLWDILLQLNEYLPNYRFYMRSHTYNGFEIVLYAVPVAS